MHRPPRTRRAPLVLQQLESRVNPNGTVTASLAGATLTLTGDDDDNVVQLVQTPGNIEVLGLSNTTIVGGPNFAGVTSIRAEFADGDDVLSIDATNDFVLSGAASLDLGDGDNFVGLNTSGKIGFANLAITAGDGQDDVSVTGGFDKGSQVTGNMSISLGVGRGDQDNPLGTSAGPP